MIFQLFITLNVVGSVGVYGRTLRSKRVIENQKSIWTCDICGNTAESWGDEKLPENWCKATLELLFNGGQFGQATLSNSKPSTWSWVDICDECFVIPDKDARTSYEQKDNRKGLAKKLLEYFKLVKPTTYNQKVEG